MRKGFTLIELLVVVSIIGLVGSVALANLQEARARARVAAGKQFEASVYHALGDQLLSSWDFEGPENSEVGSGEEILSGGEPTLLYGNSNNAVYTEEGVEGSAVLLSGDDSYLAGSGFPPIDADSDLTVSAWVKPSDIANENAVLFQGGDGLDDACSSFGIGISGGRGYVNGGVITTDRIITNNVWQQITFVFHRSTETSLQKVDTFLNGQKISTVENVGTSACANGEWSIGALISLVGFSNQPTDTYNGQIDSVRVYGSALTAQAVGALFAAESPSHPAIAAR